VGGGAVGGGGGGARACAECRRGVLAKNRRRWLWVEEPRDELEGCGSGRNQKEERLSGGGGVGVAVRAGGVEKNIEDDGMDDEAHKRAEYLEGFNITSDR
jgi:hypothetical protein